MKIGIDIDDTITNTSEVIIEYAKRYDKDFSNCGEIINSVDKIVRGKLETNNIKDFFNTYIEEILERVKVKENAIDTIRELNKLGYEIILITTRGEKLFKNAVNITNEYLNKNNIYYDYIIFDAFEKLQECIENGIDIMIDDSEEICEKLLNKNIKPVLFKSINNKDCKINVSKVDNWIELKNLLIK